MGSSEWKLKEVNGTAEYSKLFLGFNLVVFVFPDGNIRAKVKTVGGDLIAYKKVYDIQLGFEFCEDCANALTKLVECFSTHCKTQAQSAPENSPRASHYQSAQIELAHFIYTP